MATSTAFTTTKAVIFTECPKGHERSVTVRQGTPEREWTFTCPLCGSEHELVLPDIVSADPA